MNETIYAILLWVLPVLLSILAFIGALGVKALIKMSNDISEIKGSLKEHSAKHDGLERRVEFLEDHIQFKPNGIKAH